jgi:putative transposase
LAAKNVRVVLRLKEDHLTRKTGRVLRIRAKGKIHFFCARIPPALAGGGIASSFLDIRSYRVYTVFVKMRQRFRFYPTPAQASRLAQVFGSCRWAYNTMLRIRTDAYAKGERINYVRSSAIFTELRHATETKWLEEVSSVPTQQSLRHLQVAFQSFFDKRGKYPSFKKKRGKQAAEYTVSGFKYKDGNLSVSQLGKLDVRWSRKFASSPTTVTITKSPAGRYYVTLVLDEVVEHLPKANAEVGIDLGINRLATLSTGERIPNPQHLKSKLKKLARLQRIMSRRKKGSGRKERARIAVAKMQEYIADSRNDYLNKVTTDLVRRFDLIATEDLNVRGMVKNHRLARSISDASFGYFVRMLEYKCEWYGKELVKIDRFFPSSKRCFDCGHIVESLSLSIREWTCPKCGVIHDRDENAAHNILAVGQTVSAQGGRVRRKETSVSKRGVRRTVNQLEHV